MDELWFRAKYPVLKSLFLGQFSLVIALPVVFRGVIADGEARPLCVVVLDISFNGLFKGVGVSPALFYLELDVQFFFDPAVQSFVDGVTGQPDYDLAKNYWKVLKHRLIKDQVQNPVFKIVISNK